MRPILGPLQAKAALHALGIPADTPNPPGGVIEKDAISQPTGMQFATPSALSLCSTLAQGRTLPVEDQINSTRHHMCETNRLGITSVIDAGGGQNFPDGYEVIQRLHDENQLTVGIGYNLFAQTPGEELSDYERWVAMTAPGAGSDMLRLNGAREHLTWSAAAWSTAKAISPTLHRLYHQPRRSGAQFSTCRARASVWPVSVPRSQPGSSSWHVMTAAVMAATSTGTITASRGTIRTRSRT
ncbi:MAG: amidohydrolase family protein [Devosia sp.]